MKKKGFTLIELIVSFVVMAILLSAVMQSLQSFIQASRKLSVVRETQKDLSFALLRMGDKIRNNTIDYQAYEIGGTCNGVAKTNGEKLCLESGWILEKTGDTLLLKKQPNQEAPLFPKNIEIVQALFTLSPLEDPEDPTNWGDSDIQRQPRVDVRLKIQSLRDAAVNFEIDTSFSSRVY